MIAFIRHVILALFAPSARLLLNASFYRGLIDELRRRGGEVREAGAFLLGHVDEHGRRIVERVLYYDDVYPDCARFGAIEMPGEVFATVWAYCEQQRLTVVADVHTHPGAAYQSESDRQHPAVPMRGHVALIVPNFARDGNRRRLGVFEYEGAHQWRHVEGGALSDFLVIGWWI